MGCSQAHRRSLKKLRPIILSALRYTIRRLHKAMHIRSLTSFAAIASLAVGLSGANAATMTYKESGVLLGAVTSGALPPVADRVPAEPSIADFTREGAKPGQAGGEIRVLMAKAKETRQMVVYGYARLVGFNDRLELVSDILKDYTVEEGRIFTLRLRKGHKWSDGHPFTQTIRSFHLPGHRSKCWQMASRQK
jgi:ABC-type transport system substrate-binding protein